MLLRFHIKSSITTKCYIRKISQTNIIKVKLQYYFFFAINSKKKITHLSQHSTSAFTSSSTRSSACKWDRKKIGDTNYYKQKTKSFRKTVIDREIGGVFRTWRAGWEARRNSWLMARDRRSMEERRERRAWGLLSGYKSERAAREATTSGESVRVSNTFFSFLLRPGARATAIARPQIPTPRRDRWSHSSPSAPNLV